MELRPLRKRDIESLSPWLPQAAGDLVCDGWAGDGALSDATGDRTVLVAVEGRPAGILAYQADAPEPDAAWVRLLAVEPGRRRLGVGGRAALALEKRLRRSVRRIYVLVPADLGLAFYFWLRLGYRPLTQAERSVPPVARPATWLVRELR